MDNRPADRGVRLGRTEVQEMMEFWMLVFGLVVLLAIFWVINR